MHPIQERLLEASRHHDLSPLSYREIGQLVGVDHAQIVKHHMLQLQKKGFFTNVPGSEGKPRLISEALKGNSQILAVPILGAANCGPATMFAEERVEGYLKISSSLLKERKSIFALRASGNSMNSAQIDGRSIDDGDYVIIAPTKGQPRNGEYVLSVIDGSANIKKFVFDNENGQVVLLSESTDQYDPIFIHPEDDYRINGRVVQVIKVPKPNLV